MNDTAGGQPRRGTAMALLLLVLGLAVGGILAEVTLRVFAHTSSSRLAALLRADPNAVLVEPHGEVGYRQRPDRTFEYMNGTHATSNAMGYRGPAVAAAKPDGTIRVILLGGSTTHGWGVNDNETIDRYMSEVLARKHPDARFEVINLAFDGYDSWQLFERLRSDGIPLDPDFVIVNTGVNDVRNARFPDLEEKDPRTVLWLSEIVRLRAEQERGRPTRWTQLKHWLYAARMPGAARSQLSGSPEVAVTAYPDAMDYFQRNLRRIASLADSAGAVLLLSTEPSALTTRYKPDDTSSISYWIGTAATTQAYRDSLGARLSGVATELAADGYAIAQVPYVELGPDVFLDDAHLDPTGNRRMAEAFVDAIEPFLSLTEVN